MHLQLYGRVGLQKLSLLVLEVLLKMADSFVNLSDDEALNVITIVKTFALDTTLFGVAGLATLINELDGDNLPLIVGSVDLS